MAFFGHSVFYAGVRYSESLQKTIIDEELQVFLELAVTHIGTIHYFGLSRLTKPQDGGDDLYIRSSAIWLSYFLTS